MIKIAIVILTFISSFSSYAFEGSYYGKIISKSTAINVAIQISLRKTNQHETLPNGEVMERIEGAFMLEGEKNSYAFSKVLFNPDYGWLELAYHKNIQTAQNSAPDMRLFLTISGPKKLTGSAYSSLWGNLGTVNLKRLNQDRILIKNRYQGKWEGKIIQDNVEKKMVLTISPHGNDVTINPPDFELQYTTGKSASVIIGRTWFNLNKVYVDYLRKVVILSQIDQSNSEKMYLKLVLNQKTGDLTGTQVGIWSGKEAQVSLSPVTTNERENR